MTNYPMGNSHQRPRAPRLPLHTMPPGWEQVAGAIIAMLAERELEPEQAEPWLKALIDYAEAEEKRKWPTRSK